MVTNPKEAHFNLQYFALMLNVGRQEEASEAYAKLHDWLNVEAAKFELEDACDIGRFLWGASQEDIERHANRIAQERSLWAGVDDEGNITFTKRT